MYINNIGAVVSSLSTGSVAEIQAAQRLHVSLLSVFNCLGRIVIGLVSDYAWNRYGTPRLYGLIVGAVAIATVQLSGAVVTHVIWLLPTTIALGFGYGAIFSAGPAIISSWFGLKRFGNNWG
jgi:MFS family permease